MAEARFKCRRRSGRRRAEGGEEPGRGRSNGTAPNHAARVHAHVRRSCPTRPGALGAPRTGEGRQVTWAGRAGTRTHADREGPAGAGAERGLPRACAGCGRPERHAGGGLAGGLVGGKGWCCFSVARCRSAGTARPSSPRLVSTGTGNLAGGRSLSARGRRLQNEWRE